MGSEFSIILMDKGEDVTSFSSLNDIKHKFRGEKVGHAGTLDKFASGLMIVMVGGATRLNPIFSSFGKRYTASIKFGEETDTLDREGQVIGESSYVPTLREIEIVLPAFLGNQKQRPPQYSAIHVGGKRAYQEARKGKEIEMEERDIEVKNISLLSYEDSILTIDCTVSKGTYIRSLGRDIALALGTRGHLVKLRRTEVGPFTLSDIGISTMELLEKTGLFSSIVFDERRKKEIDNGVTPGRFILSDSDPSRPFALSYMGTKFYGIVSKKEKLSFLYRSPDGNL